jgi:hypothetical protein
LQVLYKMGKLWYLLAPLIKGTAGPKSIVRYACMSARDECELPLASAGSKLLRIRRN